MQTPSDRLHGKRRARLIGAAALAGGIALATLTGTALATAARPDGRIARDLAARDRDIHWPVGFEPEKADLFAHNEAMLEAPCETAWRHIIDAAAWPGWYPNARDVALLDGATKLGPDVAGAGPHSTSPSRAACTSSYRAAASAGSAAHRESSPPFTTHVG